MNNMDNSIWTEQVEDGWLKLIPSVVTCEYKESEFTPITTAIGNPEQDLDDFYAYPRCAIVEMGEDFAFNRNDNRSGSIVTIDGNIATVRPPSQPFYLYYSIEFHSKFKSDINRITRLWRAFTGRAFSLPVILPNGNVHKCPVDLLKSSQQDNLDREIRRYQRTYYYRVWVDLCGEEYSYPVATSMDNKNGTGGN